MASANRRASEHHILSDLGAVIRHSDGVLRHAIPSTIETIAIGSRATAKRARRSDPLDAINLTDAQRAAAKLWRQAHAHMGSNLPWKPADGIRERRRADGPRMTLLPQERAVTAAAAYRQGLAAMGPAAYGAVMWIVIVERSLSQYERFRGWRNGRGKRELDTALERLANAFGT